MMREISASEVSRDFAAVLDAVERGETIVVTRSGRVRI
jgi:prevent-host-death family protein